MNDGRQKWAGAALRPAEEGRHKERLTQAESSVIGSLPETVLRPCRHRGMMSIDGSVNRGGIYAFMLVTHLIERRPPVCHDRRKELKTNQF